MVIGNAPPPPPAARERKQPKKCPRRNRSRGEKGRAVELPGDGGQGFFLVLCLNILVISFEFSGFKTLAIFFFVLAVLFFLLYLSTTWEVFAFLKEIYNRFDPRASTSFYYALVIDLVLVFSAVFLTTRFNYWIIGRTRSFTRRGCSAM